MVDVRFESRPTTYVLPTTPFVRVLARWARGERLANRLPNLSLITDTENPSTRHRYFPFQQSVLRCILFGTTTAPALVFIKDGPLYGSSLFF